MIVKNIMRLFQVGLTCDERKVIFIASLGSMLDFYDFIIFGFLSIFIIQNVLQDHHASELSFSLIFTIFIVGYLVNPIGMKIYSLLAKRCHLAWSVSLISLMLVFANLYFALISVNSGFAWLHGLFAIALIRVMQGLASGAFIQMELNYLNDKLAHKIDLALFGIMAGIELGQLLGVSIYRLTNVLFSAQQMEQFAWRIPFVVGVVFTLIAYVIRLAVIFSLKSTQPSKRPQMYYHIYTRFPLQSQLAIIISGLTGLTVFIFLIFIPYGMYYHLHYSVYLISHYIFMANLLSLLINFGLNKLVRFHNVVLITWLATMALVPSMLFWGWAFINKQYGLASILPIAVLASIFSGLVPRLLYGLFPEVSRALGVASCHRVGFIFFGGVAPLITIALGKVVHHLFPISNHNVLFSSSVIIYVIFMALLTLYALAKIKRLVDYKLLSKLDYQSGGFKV